MLGVDDFYRMAMPTFMISGGHRHDGLGAAIPLRGQCDRLLTAQRVYHRLAEDHCERLPSFVNSPLGSA